MYNQHIKYIYICSAGHSGSTLLDLLIGSHSRIESLGEIAHLPKNISLNTICTCGSHVHDCRIWKQVLDVIKKDKGIDMLDSPYAFNMGFPNPRRVRDNIHNSMSYQAKRKFYKGLGYAELRFGLPFFQYFITKLNEAIVNTIFLYDTVMKVTGADIVVDSSKTYLEAVKIYLKTPLQTRIILLSRDGRGVLYSLLKRGGKRKDCVKGWVNTYSRALKLIRRHVSPTHMKFVKYEELAQKPKSVLKDICAFLSIPFEPDMLNFMSHEHHITNGNDMRFNKNSNIRFDHEWQMQLTEDDIVFFNKNAMHVNQMLGYV